MKTNKRTFFDIHIALIIMIFLSLWGCKTPELPNLGVSQDTVLLDDINAKAKNDQAWFENCEREKCNIEKAYDGTVNPGIAIYLENNIYLYENKKVVGYVNSIIDRLLAGWQGEKPEITVVVETGAGFNAYIDELNLLHLTTGLLREIENEDQLASVLAHEISHVLLRHNSEKSITKRTETVFDISGMLMIESATFADSVTKDTKFQKKGRDGQLGSQALGLVWADMLAPVWSRANEKEADMMGLDLLIRADYNYEELPVVIEKVQDELVNRSKRLELFSAHAYSLVEKNKEKMAISGNSTIDTILQDVGVDFGEIITTTVSDMIAEGSVSHDDRVERIDAMKRYLQLAHDGGDLPPESSTKTFNKIVKNSTSKYRLKQDLIAIDTITTLQAGDTVSAKQKSKKLRLNLQDVPTSSLIAKSSVNIKTKTFSTAKTNLAQLTRNPKAPAEAYIELAELYLADTKYTHAENVLELGKKRIGRDYRFLPTIITVQKESGHIDDAEENTLRCKEYDDLKSFSLRKLFTLSYRGSYYHECAAALGYDVIAKREEAEKDSTTSILKDTLGKMF